MVDISKVANMMSGENFMSIINIDMNRCIDRVSDGCLEMNSEAWSVYREEIYNMWSTLRKYDDDIKGNRAFRLEECICTVAGKDESIFNGIECVNIKFPEREVTMFINHDGDIIDAYNNASSNGRCVDVQYKSHKVAVVKERMSIDDMRKQRYFICVNYKCEVKPNTTVPAGIRLTTPIKLVNNKVLSPIIVKDGGAIETSGSVSIEAITPIIADGVDEVIIRGTGCLTLVSNSNLQPCIGTMTVTGMSYGRWSPSGSPPSKIIIDGVVVNCKSTVENFTLGKYGIEKVPTLEFRNKGRIICPEAEGERVVTKQAKAPSGSTKINELMEYSILKKGMIRDELINEGVKVLIKELPSNMRKYVNYKTQVKNIEEALRLCKMNPNLDVSLILDGDKDISRARTACLLHCNNIYHNHEFVIETNKIEYIASKYSNKARIEAEYGQVTDESILCCILIAVYDTLDIHITFYDYEVLYEMIPAYSFNGWVRGHKDASVDAYIKDNANIRKLLGKIRTNLKINEFIEDMQM